MSTLLLAPSPRARTTEREVRAQLRRQIARLEADLPPGRGHDTGRGARILSVEELEQVRDDLVRKQHDRRFSGGEEQERKRRLREEMLLHPEEHRGRTVSNAEVGEPGCTRWFAWFRVVVSGGCP
jgi:hypothetical protein